jgi:hypothetical protein
MSLIKIARVLRRHPGASAEDFKSVWTGRHADGMRRLLASSQGVSRYAQSFPLPVPRPVGAAPVEEIDCIDELWCDSFDAAVALFDAPDYWRFVAPQALGVVDTAASEVLCGSVYRKLDRPLHPSEESVKMMILGVRRADLSPHEFRRYWLDVHSVIAVGSPSLLQPEGGARRLEFCPAQGVAFGGLPASRRDALVAAWFDRAAHAQAEFTSDYYREQLQPDEPRFSDLSKSFGMVTREVCVWELGSTRSVRA